MNTLRAIIATFVLNPVLANLAAFGILVAGGVYAMKLPRETFPETSVDHLLVTVPYPGASARDVEEAVCVKIEQSLEGIPGIWEIGSISSDNVCTVVAAYDTRIASSTEVLRQAQDRVHSVKNLPPETERPIVEDSVVRNPVMTVAVYGNASESTIKQVAEDVRNDLLADPGVSQVQLSGVRDYEVSIQLREETLREYGLSLQQVMDVVARSSLNLPAGTVRTRGEEINVRTAGERYTATEFANLVVLAPPDGTSIRLGQVANIRESFEDIPLFGRVNGQPGAMVLVTKGRSEDISDVAAVVRKYVEATRPKLPEGIHLTMIGDKSRDVDARVDMLIKNGLVGMALLMGCLLIFMDVRAAFGVAMGLPVAIAGAILVMGLTGQSINLISLFALIMADAIVLDDSIVIADSVVAREKTGVTPALAAIDGTAKVSKPVVNASLTTTIMFMPLMFVEGVMGKLIYVLPVVVIASIGASLAEAFLILPAHLCEWKGTPKKVERSGWRTKVRAWLNRHIDAGIVRGYRPLVRFLMEHRLIVLSGSAAALLICAGLILGGRTPFVLFPKLDCNSVRARVRFPEGTPVEVSRDTIDRMERAATALNDDPDLRPAKKGPLVEHVYSLVGEWPDFLTTRGSGLCETNIELMSSEDRRIDVAVIMEKWRSGIGEIPYGAVVNLTREELGPRQKPIEIRLLGDDLDELRAAADELGAKLRAYEGVHDVDDDLLPGKRELRVLLRPEARTLGITEGALAAQLRQSLYGGEAVRVQRGRHDVRVVVSFEDADRRSLQAIEELRVRTPQGDSVPFREVAETQMVRGWASIGRQDGHRRIRIHADIDERTANAERVVQSLEASFLPQLAEKYSGIRFTIDGERKRISESLDSLLRAFVVAIVATYAVLGAALRSYIQPAILMAAVPLGLAGAVVGHTVMGLDLSLMSVFGMTAVAGIVVNDALVLVDQIKLNLAEGMTVRDAVCHGAESRVIAVFLTAITNVAGMAPLIAERSSQALPLIPVAVSVAFGLCFAMVLTLLIVPALYLAVNDLRRVAHWLWKGGPLPTAEQVEPVDHQYAGSAESESLAEAPLA